MSDYTPHPLVPKGQTAGKTKGPTPARTISQTSTKQYTHEEAQSYALQAFQNAIGRAPSSQELDAFMTSFNAGQNPSTTTTHYATGGQSSSSVTTGGVDAGMLAQNIAEQNPEYAGYQKATTYFDAMLSALQGPMGGSV
jgi:hypothetical protein